MKCYIFNCIAVFALALLSAKALGGTQMVTAEDVIKKLGLEPLPGEGGFYREVFRSNIYVRNTTDNDSLATRVASTAIHYLVTPESFSSLHRLPTVEVFHFYAGDPVEMMQLTDNGVLTRHILGSDVMNDQHPQVVVPAGVWQATKLVQGGRWALLGTTVAPGFEFSDLELGSRDHLTARYPSHCDAILSFTRDK